MPLPLYLGLSRTEHSGASTSAVFPERQISGLSFESHERIITGSIWAAPELFPHGSSSTRVHSGRFPSRIYLT